MLLHHFFFHFHNFHNTIHIAAATNKQLELQATIFIISYSYEWGSYVGWLRLRLSAVGRLIKFQYILLELRLAIEWMGLEIIWPHRTYNIRTIKRVRDREREEGKTIRNWDLNFRFEIGGWDVNRIIYWYKGMR